MKKWSIWQIVLFVTFCVGLNVGGKFLAVWLELPLWLDSFGTALCAFIAGPVCGALAGVTGNLSYCVINHLSAAYSITSICLGVILGIAAKRKWFDRFYGFMKTATLAMVTALIVSLPVNLLLDKGRTGNKWGNSIIDYLLTKDFPPIICSILGQLAIEFADKLLTVAAVYLVILLRRIRSEQAREKTDGQKSVVTAAVLCLAAGLAFAFSTAAKADVDLSFETQDYNDYVQTIYSSNNGLPCGEANDIAQTNDGVLWIGTYAGLYRYNGREFRWIDSYKSVKNVNCLYVDEEGRLWIGTNDNGLSIVIREEVVNVMDQSSGLPSNSVRCITRASDGLYYIGTTGSMQVVMMNNGLKATNTLDEVNYADNICSDENGNVAVVTSDGRLFLLNGGNVLATLQRSDTEELFKCCTFAPDGTLKVGSTKNHIYTYKVEGRSLKLTDTTACEGISYINNLHYLSDGSLFVTSDTGIAYINGSGYNWLNTMEFNNSVDNMICDYQGNLWFTSSRLGLLRLAKSPFKDVYGSVGLDRVVVNAVVFWQNNYYIGTDKGLDIVDKNCRVQINNAISEELEGKRIRCMYVDNKNHLWICTYGSGLKEYAPDHESWTYNADSGTIGNRARVVTGLKDGTVVAAGDAGISFIKDHKIVNTVRYEDGLVNTTILTIIECDDGSILAGTDGDGIAVLKDGKVARTLTRENGLTSGVILRMVKDPKTSGVFIVTSNSLCYLDAQGNIRPLDKFPYFNNYDIWVKDEDTLFVMSSAGIYVVERDELVEGGEMAWELLDARRGLGTSLTANSWNYYNGNGELFIPCDTGVYSIDVEKYNSDVRSYRMQIASVRLDGILQPPARNGAITIGQGVTLVEFSPEILNYTIQEPNIGYYLSDHDPQWTILPQSNLNNIIYTNLKAGTHTFHLAIFDSSGERILEERRFELIKVGEFYEQPGFTFYLFMILLMIIIWFTWFVVQRQLNQQQIKLDMANETVMAIAKAVDAKDVRTHQHSMRVAEYSALIAEEMNCFGWWNRNKEISNLKKAAQLHDIGKIGVPDVVLNKVGRLTDEEYVQMKSHVTRGAEILKDFTLVEHVEEGARYHHERYDGRGYPDGLKGEDIPLIGRIISVADAFDAMTSNRVYRNHMDTDYVINEMKRGRGTQFDPNALDAFFRLIDKGIINLDELYAQKRAEIAQAEQEEELSRRVEEDKKIQEAQMQDGKEKAESSADDKGGTV